MHINNIYKLCLSKIISDINASMYMYKTEFFSSNN